MPVRANGPALWLWEAFMQQIKLGAGQRLPKNHRHRDNPGEEWSLSTFRMPQSEIGGSVVGLMCAGGGSIQFSDSLGSAEAEGADGAGGSRSGGQWVLRPGCAPVYQTGPKTSSSFERKSAHENMLERELPEMRRRWQQT